MPSAGDIITVPTVPGARIATTVVTASVTVTTTETVVMTVVAPLVIGRIYRVRHATHFNSTVIDDRVFVRFREDSPTGTSIQAVNLSIGTINVNGEQLDQEVEFTAVATANKTFVLTAEQTGGTGVVNLRALSSAPVYLYVDYIRG